MEPERHHANIVRTSVLGIATVAGLVCIGAGAQLAAQDGAPQRTVPDFSSGLAGWVNLGADFRPVADAPEPSRNNPAYPYVSNQAARDRGTQATFRIADLTHPNIKPWAKEVMKRENEKVLAGGIGYTPRSSCMPAGVPLFNMFPVAEPLYFVQTPKRISMIFAGDAQVRRIYMDVQHSTSPKPSWYGESIGHYEGDTLVVDTIGQRADTYVDNYRTPHTEKLHVMERWRLAEDKTLEVQVTVDDPDTFYQPWKATHRYRRIQRPITYEEVCAENNQQVFDYKIPIASKPDF